MATDDNMIAALKRERAGYVARGLHDRIAQVDEQLRRHGYKGQQDPVSDPDGAPKGRTSPGGQHTADRDPSSQQDTAQDGSDPTQPPKPASAKKAAAAKKTMPPKPLASPSSKA